MIFKALLIVVCISALSSCSHFKDYKGDRQEIECQQERDFGYELAIGTVVASAAGGLTALAPALLPDGSSETAASLVATGFGFAGAILAGVTAVNAQAYSDKRCSEVLR